MEHIPTEEEATQQGDGSFRCTRCRGDWYACDCPRPRETTSILPD